VDFLVLLLAVGAVVFALLGQYVGAGLVVLILVFSRVADTSSVTGVDHVAAESAVVLVALIIFGLRTAEGGSKSLGGWRIFWAAAVLYLAVLYASAIWSANGSAALSEATNVAKDLLVVYIIAEVFDTLESQRMATWTLIIVGAGLAGLAGYQALTHTQTDSYFGLAQAAVRTLTGTTMGYRSTGPIGDPNFFGLALAVVVPLGLFRIRAERALALRVLAVVATTLMLIGIALTYSRTALVATLIGFLGFIAWSKIPLRYVLVCLLLLLPLAAFAPTHYWKRAFTVTSSDLSIRERGQSDRVAVEIFVTHPLAGVGAGNYPNSYFKYAVELHDLNAAQDAHDLYLQTASESGLLGLLTLGGAVAVVIWRTWRARRQAVRDGENAWGDLLGAHLLALMVFLVGGLFLPNAYPAYMWLLVGLCIAATQGSSTRANGAERRLRVGRLAA
jgi:putative inorganic carbon (HCO3(-)) transporter